jgi:hypothetical protein
LQRFEIAVIEHLTAAQRQLIQHLHCAAEYDAMRLDHERQLGAQRSAPLLVFALLLSFTRIALSPQALIEFGVCRTKQHSRD